MVFPEQDLERVPTESLLQLFVHDQGLEGIELTEIRMLPVQLCHLLVSELGRAARILSDWNSIHGFERVQREQVYGDFHRAAEGPIVALVVVSQFVVVAPAAALEVVGLSHVGCGKRGASKRKRTHDGIAGVQIACGNLLIEDNALGRKRLRGPASEVGLRY